MGFICGYMGDMTQLESGKMICFGNPFVQFLKNVSYPLNSNFNMLEGERGEVSFHRKLINGR